MGKTTDTDYEVNDFKADVIEASRSKPVVVDFWAPWCGPCRQLSPVLEELAEAQDEWTLVKVNTDENAEAARSYGVRGIPAVKLFVDGTVEAEFQGALPKHAVSSWLEENLPSESKARLEQAREALDEGNRDEAAELLEPVVEDEPDNGEAKVLLARALVFENAERARALAEEANVADGTLRQIRESVQTLARLVDLAETPDALPEGDGRDDYLAGVGALAEGDFDTAVERFIDVVRTNRDYDDDGARRACVALFTLLGPQHPVTKDHRRSFDMALY
jgi:putative thioredoxin